MLLQIACLLYRSTQAPLHIGLYVVTCYFYAFSGWTLPLTYTTQAGFSTCQKSFCDPCRMDTHTKKSLSDFTAYRQLHTHLYIYFVIALSIYTCNNTCYRMWIFTPAKQKHAGLLFTLFAHLLTDLRAVTPLSLFQPC